MKKKVLIIEDDVFLAEVLINKLLTAGFEVVSATNGRLGFEKIKSIRPDLVLLDIILPEMNGYQILEAKQIDASIKDIPVIIISNSSEVLEIKRALALGVSDYLVKADTDPDAAIEKVKQELEKPKVKPPEVPVNTGIVKGVGGMAGKTILWVEDDRFLKDIITVRLSNEGSNLQHASDDIEAFSILSKGLPDVIILDILLPGVDGFEILKKIKASDRTKNVPVIILSNLSQPADLQKGKDLGAVKFLIKSTITLDEIINEIKSVLLL